MSQDTTTTAAPGKSKKPTIESSAAARGYVATQQSLHGLMNDLLGTVKGLRKVLKDQQEKVEELTKQVKEQKEELNCRYVD